MHQHCAIIYRNERFQPAHGAYCSQPSGVIVKVDVCEHERQAEVRKVVAVVKSCQIFSLKRKSTLLNSYLLKLTIEY